MQGVFGTIYRGVHDQSFEIEKHHHSCYEIVYYINGEGETFVGDKAYKFSNNTFCINPPSVKHFEKYNNTTNLFFVLFNVNEFKFKFEPGIYADSLDLNILSFFEKLQDEFKGRKENYQLKMDILVLEMLIEVSRLLNSDQKSQLNYKYIKQFIDENYNMKIDISALADMAGYSYDRFRHIFKEQFGMSVTNYILKVRLLNAKKMLETSKLLVSDIASRCGFASTSQFINYFKDHEGKTPFKYRKSSECKVKK